MIFGVKYRHEFYDHFGNKFRVDILNDGYVGAIHEVTGGGTPLQVHWLGDGNDIDSVIVGSEANLQIYSTTDEQYNDIFSGKVREWMMRVYKNSSPPSGSYVLIWIGYIDPEGYSEPYLYQPYKSTVNAYDGLGDLKELRPVFGYSGVGLFNQVNNEIYYIATILDLLGFDLSIYVNNQLLHNYMTNNRLPEDTYYDFRSFINEKNEFLTGYEILEHILRPYGARIYQAYGRWYIDRLEDKRDDSTTYLIYDSSGVYQSTTTETNKVTLSSSTGSPLCVWENQSQVLEISPAWKEFTINQDLIERNTIFGHYDFSGVFTDDNFHNYNSSGISYDFIWWYQNGKVDLKKTSNTDYFQLFDGYNLSTNYLYSTTITLNPPFLFQLTGYLEFNPLRFEYQTEMALFAINPNYYTGLKMVVYNANAVVSGTLIVIYPGSNTYTYYYEYNQSNHGWSEDFKYIVQSYSGPGFQENIIVTDYILIHKDYTGYVDVSTYIYGGSASFPTSVNAHIKKHAVKIADYSNEVFEYMNTSHTDSYTENIDSLYRKVPSDINIAFGDKTIDYLNRYYNKNCRLVDTGSYVYDMTDDWMYNVGTAGQPLINGILRNWFLANKRQPLRILSGELIVDDYGFSKEIKDSIGRIYTPTGLEWDVKRGTWRGEWNELYTEYSTVGGAFDDESFNNSFDI